MKNQQQRFAEAEVEEFKHELGPFVIAAETTRMAMAFTDARGAGNPIIFANDAFLKLTGYGRDEVLGQDFNFLLASGSDEKALGEIAAAFADPAEEGPEFHYRRKDGSECWASLFVNPVKDKDGAVVQHFLSLMETTRYKTAERNAALLIDELNHRVKNTLSTVQSIVQQALRRPAEPAAIREAIESRILALSRSHDLLTSANWSGVGLHDLVDMALQPFEAVAGQAQRLTAEGNNVRLPPKSTLALAIAFHELATNAVKYGALSNDAGSVSVSWATEPKPEGERLLLYWEERDGPPVAPTRSKGFGSWVIERGLAHELGGRVLLEYPTAGVQCRIEIPVPREVPR